MAIQSESQTGGTHFNEPRPWTPGSGADRGPIVPGVNARDDKFREDKSRNDESDANEQTEGDVARSIERQTAKIPSDAYLWLAVGAMGTSAALQLAGNRQLSLFVGQWVPAFLLFGVYNKLVKQLGSDRATSGRGARA